jgi:hypothetical protein
MSKTQEKLKRELFESSMQFVRKENELLHYLMYTIHLETFELYLEKHDLIDDVFKFLNRSKNDYEKSKQKLIQIDKSIQKVNAEMVYKLYYQNFEEFLSNLFFSIFFIYPKFLKKDSELVSFEFEILYEKTSIEDIRKIIIEKKVKELIQSNNISNTLKKFKSIFGLDLPITEDEIKLIIFFSLNRNIITHNDAIINSIYLAEVKRFNLKNDFKLGENIFNEIEKLTEQIQNTLPDIASKIYRFLDTKVPQIELYSEKL